MHNPWDGNWPLVCDWACHLARGSAGGDDYAMVVGTPVTASFSGTLRNVYDTATNLNKAELTADFDPALSFYHLHVSQFVAEGHYNEGDVIAYSGGAHGAHGSGTATGPHLHVNAFYGSAIHDVHDYFSTTTAGSGSAPITEHTGKAKNMAFSIIGDDSNNGFYSDGLNYVDFIAASDPNEFAACEAIYATGLPRASYTISAAQRQIEKTQVNKRRALNGLKPLPSINR